MEKVVLAGSVRTVSRKSANGQLRRAGKIPGVLYAKSIKPIAVTVLENSINPLVFTSETHVISLHLDDNQEFDCVLKDVQFDPVTDRVRHFDLHGITSGEKIEIEIPVLQKGSSVGVRDGGLLQALHKITVKCLPSEIPDNIEIDISNLKMGQAIHISDLNIPNVEFLHGPETVVVSVAHPRNQADTTADGDGKTEPEVIAKGKEKQSEE
ncbi:MAG: 50S ribosomal protein L25 [Ignavibacteriales bacterium]|nr:50S ribosomal protein L25 [Ignavibacteriales bacterium]